jgi:hypothetical protein
MATHLIYSVIFSGPVGKIPGLPVIACLPFKEGICFKSLGALTIR